MSDPIQAPGSFSEQLRQARSETTPGHTATRRTKARSHMTPDPRLSEQPVSPSMLVDSSQPYQMAAIDDSAFLPMQQGPEVLKRDEIMQLFASKVHSNAHAAWLRTSFERMAFSVLASRGHS